MHLPRALPLISLLLISTNALPSPGSSTPNLRQLPVSIPNANANQPPTDHFQIPLSNSHSQNHKHKHDPHLTKRPTRAQVVKILKKEEVIPTVLDVFYPSFLLNVTWGPHASAALGNLIGVELLQGRPEILLEEPRVPKKGKKGKHDDDDDDDEDGEEGEEEEEEEDEEQAPQKLNQPSTKAPPNNLIITMTDPDAPTRSNPKWSEMCHWIAIGLSMNLSSPLSFPSPSTSLSPSTISTASLPFKDILEYKPPAPPAGTGKHRYVLTAWAPANGTTEPLDLVPPKERRHWGKEERYGGVRDWAEEMGLAAIGANFIYAEHA